MNCVQSSKETKIQKSIETMIQKIFGSQKRKFDSGVIIKDWRNDSKGSESSTAF